MEICHCLLMVFSREKASGVIWRHVELMWSYHGPTVELPASKPVGCRKKGCQMDFGRFSSKKRMLLVLNLFATK
jgi:hypothetical protein